MLMAMKDKTVFAAIKEMVHSDKEAYYIIWKYAPELLPNIEGDKMKIATFKDLQAQYKALADRSEQTLAKCLYNPDVQQATRYLLKRLDGKRDIDLLNKYYELAMQGDTQCFSTYLKFKKEFFADEATNELKNIIASAPTKMDYSDIEDMEMEV